MELSMTEVAIWADGTVAMREEIGQLTFLSDDYVPYTLGPDASELGVDYVETVSARVVAANFPHGGPDYVWGWDPRREADAERFVYQTSDDGMLWLDSDYYWYERNRLTRKPHRLVYLPGGRVGEGSGAISAELRMLRRRVEDLETKTFGASPKV
jgi:hypothetical protein